MKKFFTFLSLLVGTSSFAAPPTSFYELQADNIDGKSTPLSKYSGKVALVVNTASQCGYTPQYEALESVYGKYEKKGLVVLGFPSNDFGAQEPGTNAEIKRFCTSKFKVSFPLFSKAHVKGPEKQPVYQFLTTNADKTLAAEPAWNFTKYLVNRQGKVVARFDSDKKPDSAVVTQAIEKELKE